MTNNTPGGAKKHRKSTEPESHKTAKMVFFLSSSSSDRLVQMCVTLSQWFLHKTEAFFTEQCINSSLFSRFEVTRGDSNCSLKNYGFLYDAIFSSCVRMRTNRLATKWCWSGIVPACLSHYVTQKMIYLPLGINTKSPIFIYKLISRNERSVPVSEYRLHRMEIYNC